jgi:hypothetical protein
MYGIYADLLLSNDVNEESFNVNSSQFSDDVV